MINEMNDPHVEWLQYQLKVVSPKIKFENPPPLTGECSNFSICLKDDILIVQMKKHYASEEEAKLSIESFLEAWKISATINHNFDVNIIDFEFDKAHIIDRDPFKVSGPTPIKINITLPSPTFQMNITTYLSTYPALPQKFTASQDVKTMWFRYQQHVEDKEPLQAMSYFCLSLIEQTAGGRSKALAKYKIDKCILDKLGKLTSAKGAENEARKLASKSSRIPLTNAEKHWIREAVKILIRRIGEHDYDSPTANSLRQVKMADLPSLGETPKSK